MATKYRLELVKVHCEKKQDTIGKDEVQVIVGGKVLFGGNAGGTIAKGGDIHLTGRSAFFTNSVQVQLVEVDAGSNNDDLGTATIQGKADVGRGTLKREFTRNNASYTLSYEVSAA
ncbi:hypothetical protein EXU48_06310 [Occultella glacieicola]|uniref:Uncharacterized protein n=1 Tax=Occultella glacieicola TaxID=2518684 RepID=A0ABY2E5K2_9MICO|nr:hypothetical protein [Occultella glacieicola]TDE95870.1 hypothetical protein EXU48_06310 [Occultella glacieicola]